MAAPKFSIIIPFYNSENYLPAAVSSVISQDADDIELILVDDCSTDNSYAIAQNYTHFDPRVRLVRLKENSGPAVARNLGISEARGEYIMFLDSDDVYSPGLIAAVREKTASSPDVIIWGLVEEYIDEKGSINSVVNISPTDASLTDREQVRDVVMELEEHTLYGYLWNKAYRRDVIGDIVIPRQTFNEDEMFNISVFNGVNTAELISFTGTHYAIRTTGSVTHRDLPDYYPLAMKRIVGLMLQQKMWGRYTNEVRTRLANLYIRYIASALERTYHGATRMDSEERKRFLMRIFASRLYRELVQYARPDSPVLSSLARALRRRDDFVCMTIGRGMYIAKTGVPGLFNAVKRSR